MNILEYKTFVQRGSEDIGAIATRTSLGRFHFVGSPFVPCSVLCEFIGGTGTAAMTAYADYMDPDSFWSTAIKTIGTVGTGTNASWLLTWDELPGYVIGNTTLGSALGPAELVIDWTNPDSNNMAWELVVVLGRVG